MKLLYAVLSLVALSPAALAQAGPALSLESALSALPNSPDWQAAEMSFQTAQRQLEAAQAATGLSLSATTSFNSSSPSAGSGSSSLSVGASASIGVLPWSAAAASVRGAGRAVERAALTRRDSRNAAYIALIGQYFALRQAAQNDVLARASQALRQNQLRVAQAQNQAGTATLEQVLIAQQNLDQAGSTAVGAAGTLALARLALANTLGQSPQSLGQPETAPAEPALPAETVEALVQRALSGRSDVLRAQSQLEDAQDGLSAAQLSRWLPPSTLSLGYGERISGAGGSTQGYQVSAGLDFRSGNASLSTSVPLIQNPAPGGTAAQVVSLGLSLSLPILAPGAEAQVNSSQTALLVAQAALQTARRAAELDVRQRYQGLITAKAALTAAKAALESASQALRTAQARLQAGTGTNLDVQSAAVSQQQAQLNLETATANAQIAALNLQNALGQSLIGGIQ